MATTEGVSQHHPQWVDSIFQPAVLADIKKYDLRLGGRTGEHSSVDPTLFDDADWVYLSYAIRVLCDSEVEEQTWLQGIRDGIWGPLIAVLLPLLVNLEELFLPEMPSNWQEDMEFLHKAMRGVAASQWTETGPLLPKLWSVEFEYYDTECGFPIRDFLPFVTPRSVTQFSGLACADEKWDGTEDIQLSLKVLILEQSNLDMQSLENLLRLCPSLERLTYHDGGAVVGNSTFIPQKLGSALRHVQDTLRFLTLQDNEAEEQQADEDWESPMPAGTLRDFPQLHMIEVKKRMLFGRGDDVIERANREERSVPQLPQFMNLGMVHRINKPSVLSEAVKLEAQGLSWRGGCG